MPSTTRYKRGDIVLVPFPFTDLSSSKRRPALVISPDDFNTRMQDLVVAVITSQLTDDGDAVTIEVSDCVDGTLSGARRASGSDHDAAVHALESRGDRRRDPVVGSTGSG